MPLEVRRRVGGDPARECVAMAGHSENVSRGVTIPNCRTRAGDALAETKRLRGFQPVSGPCDGLDSSPATLAAVKGCRPWKPASNSCQ